MTVWSNVPIAVKWTNGSVSLRCNCAAGSFQPSSSTSSAIWQMWSRENEFLKNCKNRWCTNEQIKVLFNWNYEAWNSQSFCETESISVGMCSVLYFKVPISLLMTSCPSVVPCSRMEGFMNIDSIPVVSVGHNPTLQDLNDHAALQS